MPSIIAVCLFLHNQTKCTGDLDIEGEHVEDDDFPDLTDRTENYLRIRGRVKRLEIVNLLY